MNILIKLTCLIGLVIAPLLAGGDNHSHTSNEDKSTDAKIELVSTSIEVFAKK